MVLYPYQSLTLVSENERHWNFLCPFHSETVGSFVVNKTEPYKLFYKCFGCGEYGSAKSFAIKYLQHDRKSVDINLSGQVDWSSSVKDKIKPMINWDALRGCPLIETPDEEKRLSELVGVSVKTLRKFGIGWRDGRFLIPMWSKGEICGISVRYYEFDGTKNPPWICHKRCITGSKHGWFAPTESTYTFNRPTFITEGWSDTAVMIEMGYQAIGRFNAADTTVHIDWGRGDVSLYIVSDTDEAGITGSQKLQKIVGGKIIYPSPSGQLFIGETAYKDIREMYIEIGKERTKKWLENQL